MPLQPIPLPRPAVEILASLRAELALTREDSVAALPFGLAELDQRLADQGLSASGLHEFAPASASLPDNAAATLFLAGIAARFAEQAGAPLLWGVTNFDLYAPGLEQVGIRPDRVIYAQAGSDIEVLALAEDALRDGSLACVIAEVRAADMTATRRLQLASSDGQTPLLLYRWHRSRERCPLTAPSSAMTRWRIGSQPSQPMPWPGVGRGRWQVELVRQRNGNPFSIEVEACDATGRLALPAAIADRTAAQERATSHAA